MAFGLGLTGELLRLSGRSWWQVRYRGGEVLSEWQTADMRRVAALFPIRQTQAGTRWEDVDHSRTVALRLLCPTGEVGEVEAPGPYKLFQFKLASSSVAVGGGSRAGQVTEAHIVGCVIDGNANCQCWAWDYGTRKLIRFQDNLLAFQNYVVGLRLDPEPLGVRL